MTDIHTGRCLCGDVRYEARGPLRDVIFCHCSQCRRTSGHHVAATAVEPDRLVMLSTEGLRWYRSSALADRGFCVRCGSSLFWRPRDGSHVSIMAGTLDDTTGLRASARYYAAEAAGYDAIDDGLPQYAADNPDH